MVQHTFQKKDLYKDFDLSFTANPLTGDLAVKKDINSINQSIKNLLRTSYYERPFQPWVGSKISKILFEPADYISMNDLTSAVEEVLNNYEPRVKVLNIAIEDLSEYNSYNIIITYQINTETAPVEVNVVLERVR